MRKRIQQGLYTARIIYQTNDDEAAVRQQLADKGFSSAEIDTVWAHLMQEKNPTAEYTGIPEEYADVPQEYIDATGETITDNDDDTEVSFVAAILRLILSFIFGVNYNDGPAWYFFLVGGGLFAFGVMNLNSAPAYYPPGMETPEFAVTAMGLTVLGGMRLLVGVVKLFSSDSL